MFVFVSYLTFIQELHTKLKSHNIDPIKWEIRSIPIVSSTQDYVDRFFRMEADQIVVLSKTQENGRGRNTNIWESPEGGVWLSIGLKEKKPVIELSTPVVEVVHSVLSNYVECKIKSPNDIYVEDKKIAGILVETKMSGSTMSNIIIGIGVNNTNELPESISSLATRLADHCEPPTVVDLASEISLNVIQKLIELNMARK